ncbi:MAG: DNA primase [Kiritimatiellia bacterium]
MAKGIAAATLEEIKARIDLADLVASYGVAVKTAGATKKACCPFHHEKTPSFVINEAKGFYHCFGCGESGDAIGFVRKMDGLTFVEAVKKLAERCGVRVEEQEDPTAGRRSRLLALLAEIAQFYHRCLRQAKAGELARAYLVERDLGEQVQADYLIGYAPDGLDNVLKWAGKYGYSAEEMEAAGIVKGPTRPGGLGYHRFGGRLMFSIRDKQGRVVGFSGRQLVASKRSGKYVNSPETLVFRKSNVLYGFDKAAGAIARVPNREAIVCEGQIDCIRLQISGFPNAVAGQGTAFTEEHVKMLKQVSDQVALVYDDDEAGHKATVKSARLCLAAELPVRVVSLPGGDDPDSFLRTHPAADFRALLDNAESIMSFQVRAERAKERDPDSIDAVNRIAREVLLTVAQCPNAVLRASMVGEAAKLLRLPSVALEEELAKIRADGRSAPPPRPTAAVPAPPPDEPTSAVGDPADETAPLAGESAASVLPPPPRELALCAFLLANEYDQTLADTVAEFLPAKVFAHDFTARFVETWRAEAAGGGDLMREFADRLGADERAWLDVVLLDGGKTQSSGLSPTDILQDFVRSLWSDALRRARGKLPAHGDPEADLRRMKLSTDLKRLSTARWHSVKETIRDWASDL